MKKYKEAVVKTTASFSKYGEGRLVDTIYFGGGTPSVMDGLYLSDIITAIKENFEVAPDAEIAVECNPSSNLEDFLPKIKSAGVNRVSMGVQSAVDGERRSLGRSADRARVEDAVKLCKDIGITNISLDVMLGVPGQTLRSLEETLDFLISQDVKHISAYMLKLEEGTVFYKRQDSLDLPNEDLICDMYDLTCNRLQSAGINQYEISNFAKLGFLSRHNLKYWHDEEYLGIGPSAHSFIDGNRFYFEADIEEFICSEDPQTIIVQDGLGGDLKEKLMLGLRLTEGVLIESNEVGLKIKNDPVIGPFVVVKEGTDGVNVSLTHDGFLISNTVISKILEYFE